MPIFTTTISTHVIIDAPVEAVWARLIDLEDYGTWNPFITSAAGSLSLDQRLTLTVLPPGGRLMTFRPRVSTVKENTCVEWIGRLGLPGIFDGRHRFGLTSMPEGRTMLEQSETFSGLLIPFAGSMIARTGAGFAAMNSALAHHTELSGRPPVAPSRSLTEPPSAAVDLG